MRIRILTALAILGSTLAVQESLPAQRTPPAKGTPPAQAAADLAGDRAALRAWLDGYSKGAIRMASMGQIDAAAIAHARDVMAAVARHDTVEAAQALFEVAVVDPEPPGTSPSSTAYVDFLSALRVGTVRGMARALIVGMNAKPVEDWLLAVARAKPGKKDATTRTVAALRILAARPGERAKQALLEGCHSFKPEVRVQAVNTLSTVATRPLLPHFFGLVRDKEPYVRIAAINGIGRALAEHTDETVQTRIDPGVATDRDKAIEILRTALVSDRVWQVRAAARENLAGLKTKLAIPALIDGLAAELRRKKDPWALDVKLHRTLEGLTGQKVPVGQVRVWQEFWRKEGPSFKFAPAGKRAADVQKDAKYEKFFDIELESNRVLFIVDFSGSMIEPITIRTPGVGTVTPGTKRTTTKAKLVVEELKKMVMTLKDGDLFNIIVFSDDVRLWKARKDGRPELVKMNDERRDELLGGYLDNLQPAGMTNLYGALERALGFGGRGLHDKYYELGFDTLYVLSDGAPTKGKITDTEEILRQVRETNALKRLTIHTITFGSLNQLVFLKKLAQQNGGRHIHVE